MPKLTDTKVIPMKSLDLYCYTTLKVVFFSERAEAINIISAITMNDDYWKTV